MLVVEDDRDTRNLFALLLPELERETGRRVRVSTAADAEAALLLLRGATPDLVLLDVMLPGVDGLELARRIRADPVLRAVPVVAVTALGPAEEVAERARAAGCADVLGKPFELEELLAVVRRHLADGAPRDV